MIFTPINDKTRKRVEMDIRPIDIPRGQVKVFHVTDTKTGKTYRCKTRSCGLPRCLCDAVIYGL